VTSALEIRRATSDELELLKELTVRSRRHWDYDAERFRAWADRLDFAVEDWGDVETYLAELEGRPVAWAAVRRPASGVAVLEELWVVPEAMGRGVGAQLFRTASARARELGASALEWAAEPGAVGFYEKLGGGRVREETSHSFGHRLPVMRLDLAPEQGSADGLSTASR
jgi:GNAT superfamily N-acetyltransferase